MKTFTLLLRLLSAGILFQTLFFKFTGAPESVYIFTQVGIEPWGRWLSGVSELIAGVLILVPATQGLGALMAVGIMSGAIVSHLTILGINVQGDGGLLFGLACTVWLSSAIVAWSNHLVLIDWARSLLLSTRGAAHGQ